MVQIKNTACLPRRELIADMPTTSHGALLPPPPPDLSGLIGNMLNDPPCFDRASVLPEVNRKTTVFFNAPLPSLSTA
ncbi:hypothetical protein [Variovorax boronicumulans]